MHLLFTSREGHNGRVNDMPPMPPPPERGLASDNFAGAHPDVMAAVAAANVGHAKAYGDDPWTAEAEARLRDLFGGQSQPFLVWNGTGANVMALATMLRPAEAVVCTDSAHIAVDEGGAPEFITGAKLISLSTPDGKLTPEHLRFVEHLQGNQHHVQPAVVSVTQGTEMGTLYSPDELAAICDAAHALGMFVHLDGARLANAVAALGRGPAGVRSFTTDAGVDVVSFGATKIGALGAEAVVYLSPGLAARARHVRKLTTQVSSKMRFIAAQFNSLLHDDLWLRLAGGANQMAAVLFEATHEIPGVQIERAPQINSMYPVLPAEVIRVLQDWSFFWDWDVSRRQVRWMTAWDTTEADIDRFAAGVRHVLVHK